MSEDRKERKAHDPAIDEPEQHAGSETDEVALRKKNVASVPFGYAALAVAAAVVFVLMIIFAFDLFGGEEAADSGAGTQQTNVTVGSEAEQNAPDTASGD